MSLNNAIQAALTRKPIVSVTSPYASFPGGDTLSIVLLNSLLVAFWALLFNDGSALPGVIRYPGVLYLTPIEILELLVAVRATYKKNPGRRRHGDIAVTRIDQKLNVRVGVAAPVWPSHDEVVAAFDWAVAYETQRKVA